MYELALPGLMYGCSCQTGMKIAMVTLLGKGQVFCVIKSK